MIYEKNDLLSIFAVELDCFTERMFKFLDLSADWKIFETIPIIFKDFRQHALMEMSFRKPFKDSAKNGSRKVARK